MIVRNCLYGLQFHDQAVLDEEVREEIAEESPILVVDRDRVLLEGLEVWLVVVALGLHGRAWVSSTAGALAALLVVIIAGLAIRAPLARIPENAIKFTVGAMITAFGTFWSLEAVGGAAVWPWSDWSLLALAAFYTLGGLALIGLLGKWRIAGAVR